VAGVDPDCATLGGMLTVNVSGTVVVIE